MIRKLFFLIAICLTALPLYAQSPEDALSEFDWLTEFVRRNYPGYEAKIQGNEEIFKESIRQSRDLISHRPDTLPLLIDEYLRQFHDGHLYFRPTQECQTLFHDIFRKEAVRRRETSPSGSINMYYTAKAMNDSTFFLRIPSFDNAMSNQMVKDNWEAITSRPYLIIDLRCNNGGNDDNFSELMRLVYSKPYWCDGVEMYATPDIAALYRQLAANEPDRDSKEWLTELADSVESHLGGYVLRPGMQRKYKVTYDTVYANPCKIGILIHGRNSSSAEQFILDARQSNKVTLFGNENTHGVIDLSNVFSVMSPKGWFELYFPTTRSCRYPDVIIDGVGISPQVPIPYEESLQEKDNIGEEIEYIERVLRGI